MPLNRRRMLLLLGASSLTPAWFVGPASATPAVAGMADPFFLILDDISAETPAAAINAVVAPFAALGIPCAFVIRPAAAEDGAAAMAAVAAWLRGFLTASPGLGEIVVWSDDLVTAGSYFALRRASDARRRTLAALGIGGADRMMPVLTLAGPEPEPRPGGEPPLDGLRAAGFRNVMLIGGKDRATVSDRCGVNMPCLRGGLRHGIARPAGPILAALRRATDEAGAAMLILSLAEAGDLPPGGLADGATALARGIGDLVEAGRLAPSLPRQHPLWFDTGTGRLIGLGIAAPPAGDEAAGPGLAALGVALGQAGFPFARLDGDDAVIVGDTDFGMDRNGILHLPTTAPAELVPAGGPQPGGAPGDIVLTVRPADYATPEARATLLASLGASTGGGAAQVLAIPALARRLLPDDPIYRLMLATRRDPPPPAATGPDPAEVATLTEDARLAWSYFERFGNTATGLCPATVFVGADWSTVNRSLTMWDYGSLILAVIAAHALHLIDDDAFRARAEALVRSLPAARIGGLVLPSSEIATDTGASLAQDFNACDTGRLLSALHRLDRHPLTPGIAAPRVAGWTLAGTIRAGRLNSVTAGRLRPFFISHCAHYAARAFALWGHQVQSPYDVASGQSATDAQMQLLYSVAGIGALGAEPLLHEAVEMGPSPAAAYLADVLDGAQRRSFAATGALVCVSEGPLDRAPWFSYQGLRVDLDSDIWDLQTIEPDPAYRSAGFRAANRVFSCKAAFLWAALRPGDHSSRLLDHARARGRLPGIGYASGIYAATGLPMAGYSDLNTNGVILQAIAHRLRHAGRRPVARPRR